MTNLRPDLVLWSSSLRTVYIIELTVPWEDAVDEASECKRLWYVDLAADAEQWPHPSGGVEGDNGEGARCRH